MEKSFAFNHEIFIDDLEDILSDPAETEPEWEYSTDESDLEEMFLKLSFEKSFE